MGEAIISRRGGSGGGSSIVNIQHINGVLNGGSVLFNDVTIQAVDMGKAVVEITFNFSSFMEWWSNGLLRAQLTDPETVRVRRSVVSTIAIPYCLTVTEYENVKGIQRGNANLTSSLTEVSVAITPVALNKSKLIFSYTCSRDAYDRNGYIFTRGCFTAVDEITFYRGAASDTVSIDWQVLEFE